MNLRATYPSFGFSALLLLSLVLAMMALAFMRTEGQLCYPIDDTYIHLSLAKNFALHGNWGLSPGVFHPSSSSPLYMLVLTFGFLLVGVNTWLPLAIGFLAGFATLYATHRIALQYGVSNTTRRLGLVAMIVLVPLPFLVPLGMEHALQVLIDVLFVHALTRERQGPGKTAHHFLLLVLAALVTGIRYEGLFLIGMAFILMIWQKKRIKGFAVLVAGALPPLTVGLVSVSKGSFFFPISILAKGQLPGLVFSDMMRWLMKGLYVLVADVFMLALLILLAGCMLAHHLARKTDAPGFGISLITAGVLLMHVIAAQVGGIRYEAYLFALAVLAGIVSAAEGDSLLHALEAGWKKFPLRRYVQLPGLRHATLAALLLPMLVRSGFFLYHYPISVQNIYQQQIQMARFVGRYYPESAIAANDIGAITFFTDIRLTDLFCIGDQEVFAAARRDQLNASFVDDLTTRRGTVLAIVYDRAVGHLLPPKWTRVATWTIPDNFICADETVSFYAIRPEGVAGLRQQLRDFSVSLPAAVKTSYDMR